jgi:outer membrane lipase/esterase
MRARLCLLALFGLILMRPAVAGPYSEVYFFGDSLTDVGNVTAVYATVPHPPGAPTTIPGAPYFENRSSNGPIYADTVAAGLGFSATPSALGGNDYAFGGARTRYQLFGAPFLGINDQVAQFRAQPGSADPTALYVMWAGANNLQDILLGRTIDALGNPIPGLAATLGDIAADLQGLYAEGARDFLVPNAPNLGRVPRIAQLGAGAIAAGMGLSQAFDAGLSAVLDGFVLGHPDAQLTRFDTYGALESIVANASSLGLTDLTDRCYTGDDLTFTGGGTVCSDPNSFLFWDGIHPTSAVSQLIGREMLAALGVPEPAEMLLFGVGLAALLAIRRRRGTD